MTHWYARGGGVKRMGPYNSQEAASRALRLVQYRAAPSAVDTGRMLPADDDPDEIPAFPPDAFVWPETEEFSRLTDAAEPTKKPKPSRRRRSSTDLSMRDRALLGLELGE